MAPSAVTVTETAPASKPAISRTFGNYKEQAAGAKAYNKKLEEEGDGHHARANVGLKTRADCSPSAKILDSI